MKKLKHTGSIIFSIVFLFGIMGVTQVGMCAGSKIVMKAAHTMPPNPDYTWDYGLRFMKKRVEQLTDGKVEVKIYGGAQLGGERAILEGLQLGTIQCYIGSSFPLSGFFKEAGILVLPHIFNDYTHVFKVLDGALGDRLKEKALVKGFRMIGWWKLGAKQVLSNVPIRKLEDFKGLRMRAPETPEFIALYKSYGAIPVPMAWAEVYSALQQGVVDGVGADWAGLLTSKLHEVTKYAIGLSHVRIIGTLIVSEKWFKTLPDDLKIAIEQAGYESQQVARDHDTRHQAAGKKECVRVGMKVYTPPDMTPFRDAGKSIYPKFYKTVGKGTIEWVQKVGKEVSY